MYTVVLQFALHEIVLMCRESDESHLRAHLLATIAQEPVALQAIHSEDQENGTRTRLRAEVATSGRQNTLVERIAMRLSIEPGVTSLSGSVVPAAME